MQTKDYDGMSYEELTLELAKHSAGAPKLDSAEKARADYEQRSQILKSIRRAAFLELSSRDLPMEEIGYEISPIERQLEKLSHAFSYHPEEGLTEEGTEAKSRISARSRELRSRIDEVKEKAYAPGPHDPPAYEPSGYSARLGYVKSKPANNEYYLKLYEEWDWYPILRRTHEAIRELAPGYNIAQIKSKFNGLRYYVSFDGAFEGLELSDELQEARINRCRELIAYAEAWVDGYEARRQENLSK